MGNAPFKTPTVILNQQHALSTCYTVPLQRWVDSSKQFFTNYANVVFLHRELLYITIYNNIKKTFLKLFYVEMFIFVRKNRHELLNDVVGSKALLREQILDVFGFEPPRSNFNKI